MVKNTFRRVYLHLHLQCCAMFGLRSLILASLLGQFMPSGLAAHPHIFIDGQLSPQISPDGNFCQGITIQWSFDQIYSAQMILEFDKDGNGKIDAQENQDIYQEAFQHLKELHYFLQIGEKNQGSRPSLAKPGSYLGIAKNFRASIENGKFIYQFYVPVHAPRHNDQQGLELSAAKEYLIYLEDEGYFIAFDSMLKVKENLDSVPAVLSSKEFMVENPAWGAYPVRAVSVKGR